MKISRKSWRGRRQHNRLKIGVAICCVFLCSGYACFAGGIRPSKRVVLWNGERENNGAGWSTPSTKDIYFQMQSQIARSGCNALEWRVATKNEWTECGWEWLGWSPSTRGSDLSQSRVLRFQMLVRGQHKPHDLHVALKSSNQKRQLPTVSIAKYNAKFADGQWRLIQIPLRDMFLRTQAFDSKKASQIFFGTWNETADFQVYIDDIEFA